jgi:hypothetical protein
LTNTNNKLGQLIQKITKICIEQIIICIEQITNYN